jgi:hypothetical protein
MAALSLIGGGGFFLEGQQHERNVATAISDRPHHKLIKVMSIRDGYKKSGNDIFGY